jgi:G3E family GTPase
VLGNLRDEAPQARQVARQIAFADSVVINKMDLVGPSDVALVEKARVGVALASVFTSDTRRALSLSCRSACAR